MGGEVVLAPEIADAPTDMIAAVSLYELTYYGFSPDERRKFPERMFGKPNPSDGPNEDDLLSEETKALCPDLDEYFDRSDEEYDKQYALYSEYVIRELKALADGGNKYGQFYLGKAYGEGSYGLEIDKAEAFRLFKESADQASSRLKITSLSVTSMASGQRRT
jgi:TPR repeat protein